MQQPRWSPWRDARPWGLRAFGRELALAALGGLAYFAIRGAVAGRADEATARAAGLLDLERSLGLAWEHALQDAILGSQPLVNLMNGIYFWTHMPVILALGVWLWWTHRGAYTFTRNAFLGSAVLALALYFVLPTAPPRLLPGFVDTMALHARANYQAQELGPFVNAYAALPSLHFGWALLVALGLWLGRPRRRGGAVVVVIVGAALVLGQFFAIVTTANHFVLDAVAGAAAAGLGVTGAAAWRRRDRSAAGDPAAVSALPPRGRAESAAREAG